MKVTIKNYHAIATWRWNLKPGEALDFTVPYTVERLAMEGADEDEDDDVCGICRVAYEGCCPECKKPGDDCPLIFGECTHIFHMHCLLKWLGTESSKNCCPMDRRPWVTSGSKEEAKVGGAETPNANGANNNAAASRPR